MYVRAPQGLPGISEYQEELTDLILSDIVTEERAGKWADNVYVGGKNEEEFIENVKEVCKRFKAAHMRASPGKMITGIEETTILGWN